MKILKLTVILIVFSCISCSDIQEKKSGVPRQQVVNVTTDIIEYSDNERDQIFYAELNYDQNYIFVPETNGIAKKIMVSIGEKVLKNQPLIEYPNQNYELQVEQYESSLANMVIKLEKNRNLLSVGYISQQELDDLELEIENMTKQLQILKEQYIVKAPFHGIITNISTKEGDYIMAGESLFSLANSSVLNADIYVTVNDFIKIEVGDEVKAEISSFPQLKGKISSKSLEIDPIRKAYKIEAEFNNKDMLPIGGSMARINIQIKSDINQIMVPLTSIISDGFIDYIYQYKDKRAVATTVKIIEIIGSKAVITTSLKVGDEYIIKGGEKVINNALVNKL